MKPRQVRAALRSQFSGIGFAKEGSRFVFEPGPHTHAIDIAAARRLPCTVEIHHHVLPAGHSTPLLTQEIASHGHRSP